jgi:hypothetical protein
MNTKSAALVAVPVVSALAVYGGLTHVFGSRDGPTLFLAVAVGVLLHFGAARIYRSHFPCGEEGDIPRSPRQVKRFWTSLYNLCLFSCLGAGVTWVAFLGNPLCYVLTLGVGALTYRLLLPLFGPDDVPRRGRTRIAPPQVQDRGEASLAVGAEELSFGQARLPGLVGVEVWRSVNDIPNGDETGAGETPTMDGPKTKKDRPKVRRVK